MLLVLALSALPALAGTEKLQLTKYPTTWAGYTSTHYELKVNGTANVPLMCGSFTNELTVDESWTANVSPITAINNAGAKRLYNVIPSGSGLMNGRETHYVAALISS